MQKTTVLALVAGAMFISGVAASTVRGMYERAAARAEATMLTPAEAARESGMIRRMEGEPTYQLIVTLKTGDELYT